MLAVVALVALAAGAGAALATHDAVAVPTGCNDQGIGEGPLTIRWTSSFNDDAYGTGTATRSGDFLVGEDMDVLEVNVQWSIHDSEGVATGAPSSLVGVALRGAGFSPEGVEGRFVENTDGHGPTVDDAALAFAAGECGVDPTAQSYRTGTFYFQFTKLHKPGKRPNAKGNAELNVSVDVGEDENGDGKPDIGTATLGTNLHVADGPDNG